CFGGLYHAFTSDDVGGPPFQAEQKWVVSGIVVRIGYVNAVSCLDRECLQRVGSSHLSVCPFSCMTTHRDCPPGRATNPSLLQLFSSLPCCCCWWWWVGQCSVFSISHCT